MDLPKEAENSYLANHFLKLDKDFENITKASKTADILTNSITFMETMRQMEANQKLQKKLNAGVGGQTQNEEPYLLVNSNGYASGTIQPKPYTIRKDAHNERAQRQDEIERRLVGQLGDRFKDAKLLEVSEGSYLIQNRIKLPIFGRTINPVIRTKSSIDKRSFLLSKQYPEQIYKKYVMEKTTRDAGHSLQQMHVENTTSSAAMPQPMPPTGPINRTGVDTFDSESDHNLPQVDQPINMITKETRPAPFGLTS